MAILENYKIKAKKLYLVDNSENLEEVVTDTNLKDKIENLETIKLSKDQNDIIITAGQVELGTTMGDITFGSQLAPQGISLLAQGTDESGIDVRCDYIRSLSQMQDSWDASKDGESIASVSSIIMPDDNFGFSYELASTEKIDNESKSLYTYVNHQMLSAGYVNRIGESETRIGISIADDEVGDFNSGLKVSNEGVNLVGNIIKINDNNINNLYAPINHTHSEYAGAMHFRGTLGTGGTITNLPAPASIIAGDMYKVITAGQYSSIYAKVGDAFVCGKAGTSTTYSWILIPSGDESFTDTWRAINVNGNSFKGNGISTGLVNFKSGSNITLSTSDNDITINATDTNTTYSFQEGSVDGAFSVTPSGGTAQSVSIHGLGGAAYKASSYFALRSYQDKLSNFYFDDEALPYLNITDLRSSSGYGSTANNWASLNSGAGTTTFGNINYLLLLLGNTDRPYYRKGNQFGLELAFKNDLNYITDASTITSDNTSGMVKIVILNSEPTTKYNGYIYIILK